MGLQVAPFETTKAHVLNVENDPCSGSVAFNTPSAMVMLIVPSVSVGLSTVIEDVDAPRGYAYKVFSIKSQN